jgi:hypothetical protein
MFFRLRRALASLFRVQVAPDRALEDRLLARYDALHPEASPRRLPMRTSRRIAVAACATLAIGLVAVNAPAQVELSLGRSVGITLPPGTDLPDAKALAGFFKKVCHPAGSSDTASCDVGVRIEKHEGEPTTVHFDVWCEGLPQSLGGALQAEFPELVSAEITEQPLDGSVETNLAGKLGHELFDIDIASSQDREALREVILQKVQSQVEPGADVDVQVQGDDDGSRQIEVRVKETATPAP